MSVRTVSLGYFNLLFLHPPFPSFLYSWTQLCNVEVMYSHSLATMEEIEQVCGAPKLTPENCHCLTSLAVPEKLCLQELRNLPSVTVIPQRSCQEQSLFNMITGGAMDSWH
jgi:hypothetical protein